jgi:predicted Zn-dependent protease with MMP-like domain
MILAAPARAVPRSVVQHRAMPASDPRRTFDELLDQVIAGLPEHLHRLMEEVPLIVEDEPSAQLTADLGLDPGDDLCGLHWGIALTDRSVEHSGVLPDRMMLFRGPILRLAGSSTRGRRRAVDRDALLEQIRITLLHEIGHHFGLDEDDLDALGYG